VVIILPVAFLFSAVALVATAILACRPRGRHVADSLARADWQPRTSPPAPPPVRLRRPRYVPDYRPRQQMIREAYASLEMASSRQLASIAAWAA
jgi:hypothetical protein